MCMCVRYFLVVVEGRRDKGANRNEKGKFK